ncbi:hypothetical protein [Kocuria rhizophila]|uniref:hypothetical protein n=1 Tax=Kocuria rhizophila TaxID=72000 RepID=UPI0021A5ED82|nr:hypothetical protein [Kocuria rhizophila]MCT1457915.1 hypothetical protein [Kocuria rhizophila]
MRYELGDLDRTRLNQIREEWTRQAGADEFAVEMGIAFEWAETHLDPKAGSSQAFELREVTGTDAKAIVEIIDSREISLTKMLTLYPAPAYWAPTTETAKLQVAELYTAALAAMIARGMEPSNMTTIKIYGRTDGAVAIFRSVVNIWPEAHSDWTAKMDGRWLTVRRY